MEYSNKLIRSSQPFLKSSSYYPQKQPQQVHTSRKFLAHDLYTQQQLFADHVKRNYRGSVNSASGGDNINNHNTNDNVAEATSNHLIAQQQHELSDSWLELILSLTFSGIVILGVVIVGIVLFVWLRRHFRETSKLQSSSSHLEDRECSVVRVKDSCTNLRKSKTSNNYVSAYYGEKKMNSRKWLGRNQQQQPEIDSRTVDDLEQRLETVKFRNSPPTSPNNETCDDDDDDEEEQCDGELTCDTQVSPQTSIKPCSLFFFSFNKCRR